MTSFRVLAEASSRWIGRVAAALLAGRESLRARPRFQLIEQPDGTFALGGIPQRVLAGAPGLAFVIEDGRADAAATEKLKDTLRGAHVELVLLPHRFLFRPLELPGRAEDFLTGIVRAQIDRLTPWSAADAAFGWHSMPGAANDRITVTIAATARTLIAPFIDALAALGADTIAVSAAARHTEPASAAIKIFEQKSGQMASLHKIRRGLIGLAAGGGALACASIAANVIIGGTIEARREDLARRIAQTHAALMPGHGKTSEAARDLERHKHETPSSVLVIEVLSAVLPDDTYLNEFRILGDKLQIAGLTRDAPALIRLIEQTPHFSRAAFFAPTTRSVSEPSEHFHIEARIEPVYTPGL